MPAFLVGNMLQKPPRFFYLQDGENWQYNEYIANLWKRDYQTEQIYMPCNGLETGI